MPDAASIFLSKFSIVLLMDFFEKKVMFMMFFYGKEKVFA